MTTNRQVAVRALREQGLLHEVFMLDADRVSGFPRMGSYTIEIIDYENDSDQRMYVDEELFECFLEDFPELWDGESFLREDLLPFAIFINPSESSLLLLDVGAGGSGPWPVILWDHDWGDEFRVVSPDIASLQLEAAEPG